jgi:hypothetical protein
MAALRTVKSPDADHAALSEAVRHLAAACEMTQRDIAKAVGKSLGWINAIFRWQPETKSPFGPTTRAERVQRTKRAERKRKSRLRRAGSTNTKTKSDWPARPLMGRSASLLPFDHPAVMTGHTIYPSMVHTVSEAASVLKPGNYQSKIGAVILKGEWKDYPVYTLTLEERSTCPPSCHHWRSCFGNKMHLAHRMEHGPGLEARLTLEIAALAKSHPAGFAVRLHVLGDFYSVEYVELWGQLLERHPQLNVWGYSARWGKDDPIAAALLALQHDRFRMRFSDAPDGLAAPKTISIQHPLQKPNDATTICPEQLGQTESCSSCALCWHSRERIAFIQH